METSKPNQKVTAGESPLVELMIAENTAPVGVDPSEISDTEAIEGSSEQDDQVAIVEQPWMEGLNQLSVSILQQAPIPIPIMYTLLPSTL